jgi:hypothetical protein
MLCPSCSSVVAKGSNFCSRCGYQVPIVVGASFPFGIRFPVSFGPAYAAAVSHARRAPCYSTCTVEGATFHVALYDRPHVSDLAELHRMVFMALPGARPLIEHTIDGHTFFSGPSFWGCFARRLTEAPVEYPEVAHTGCRCHSLFGCLAAQKRQHEMYHREGWEVFYNGRHGYFPGGEDAFTVDGPGGGSDLVSGPIDRAIFMLDRAKVRSEAMNLVRRAGAHRCPLFSPSHFDQQIKRLPSLVEVGETPGWRYLECAVHGPAVAWSCY